MSIAHLRLHKKTFTCDRELDEVHDETHVTCEHTDPPRTRKPTRQREKNTVFRANMCVYVLWLVLIKHMDLKLIVMLKWASACA